MFCLLNLHDFVSTEILPQKSCVVLCCEGKPFRLGNSCQVVKAASLYNLAT
ncbi:hypothetical protein V5799_000553, partial [Amblyomma americanum]